MKHFSKGMKRHYALLISSVLSSLLLTTGCASPLPNLHSKYFSKYYDNVEQSEGNNIDKEWDRFAGIPIELNEDQFGKMILRSSLPVLVEFSVTWCGYCEQFKPIFGEIAQEYVGKVRFASINAEENKNLASIMGVEVYPTFFLIKDGNVLDGWRGTKGGKYTVEKRLKSKLDIE